MRAILLMVFSLLGLFNAVSAGATADLPTFSKPVARVLMQGTFIVSKHKNVAVQVARGIAQSNDLGHAYRAYHRFLWYYRYNMCWPRPWINVDVTAPHVWPMRLRGASVAVVRAIGMYDTTYAVVVADPTLMEKFLRCEPRSFRSADGWHKPRIQCQEG
jgi:hypothetical protein